MGHSSSFLDVQASIYGPGGNVSLAGEEAGVEQCGITVTPAGERSKMTVGADGSVMHSLLGDKSGTVSVKLLKTLSLIHIWSAGRFPNPAPCGRPSGSCWPRTRAGGGARSPRWRNGWPGWAGMTARSWSRRDARGPGVRVSARRRGGRRTTTTWRKCFCRCGGLMHNLDVYKRQASTR